MLVLQKVNKNTRAKKDGTQIICPYCTNAQKVYHFCWSALSCRECGKVIDKADWLIIRKSKYSPASEAAKEILKQYQILHKKVNSYFSQKKNMQNLIEQIKSQTNKE